VGDGLLAHVADPARELLAGVGEDLADRVVGLDVPELFVRRPLVVRCRFTGGTLRLLACCGRLLAQLLLEVRDPPLEVGVRRRWRSGGGANRTPSALGRDLRVRLLDLLEPPRGLA
jgi:hypothetical protein